MVFQNANYFLNFQKLLGIAKGVKVDNETSQQQIIKMYKLGHEIPWDMRKAQPAIQQLEREGYFTGLILDAGCGFGDNGIYLAQKGYTVVGFDFSAEAIEIARERAAKAGVAARTEWVVADALNIQTCKPLLHRRFDTILDCACLQCFDPKTQITYVTNMASLLRPYGKFVVLVVCNQSQLRSWCRGLSWMRDHVDSLFSPQAGWKIIDKEPTTFLENIPSVRMTANAVTKEVKREFLEYTESPCLRVVAQPLKSRGWAGRAVPAGLALAAVVGCLFLVARRRH